MRPAHDLLCWSVMDSATFTRIARDAPFFDEGHGFDVFGLHPPSLANAVALARLLSSPSDTVVVCGSLYLIGEVRSVLESEGHGGLS